MKDIEKPIEIGNPQLAWGSDAIAEMLRRLDIPFVALNPGASFRGLHDSLVNYLGNRMPQMLMVLHEQHAVAIAHGYAKIAERPMAAVLHSNVGLMNGAMGIYNAWCDRMPVLVLGAQGPNDAVRRRPWIDWIHTTSDPAAHVRDYTKWDNQPASVGAALEALTRAVHIAETDPKGPVFVSMDVTLQEDEIDREPTFPELERYRPAGSARPSEKDLHQAVGLLHQAQSPVILAGRLSRNEKDWANRIRLAEALGAKVLTDLKTGATFPTRHPLHATPPGLMLPPDTVAAVAEADVILSLDWIDLGGLLSMAFKDRVIPRVISCSLDVHNHRGWADDHYKLPPVDLPISTDPDAAVSALLDHLGVASAPQDPMTPIVHEEAESEAGVDDLTTRSIARALNATNGKRELSVVRIPLSWPGDLCHFDHPMDYAGFDGGGGLGSGPGMAIGSALALMGSGRLPVAVTGDGDFLMGGTALWTAAKYRIPLLFIIANNRSYMNDVHHQHRVAEARARPVENRWIGQRIDEPAPDLAAFARSQGVDATGPITTYEDLVGAIEFGLSQVKDGTPYLIEVIVSD